MTVRQLTTPAELERYERWVTQHPHGSLWQSPAWRAFQEARGRDVRIYAALNGEEIRGSAMVVIDRGRGGSTWEIPRGPLGDSSGILDMIRSDAKTDGALALFFSPATAIEMSGTLPSGRHIHAEATRILDLTKSEEEILAQMHQKGRYNIKVAQKNGIIVRPADDAKAFHALLTATAARDAFTGHSQAHYDTFLRQIPGSFLLMAYTAQNEPVAGLLGVVWGKTGIYYYGASSYAHRNLMAPYLLQWEAMRLCKGKHSAFYDLLGIAPVDAGPQHPWQGISDFKAKFGGSVVTYPAERMITLQPMKWTLLQMKRKFLG